MAQRPASTVVVAVVAFAWVAPALATARDPVVPLARLDGGLWTLQATTGPEGRPLTLLLDTGAERTVIDADAAASRGLIAVPWGLLGTPAGLVEAGTVRLPRLAIGPHVRTDLAVLVADLSVLGVGTGVDGILGMDALAAPQIVIDLVNGALSFPATSGAVSIAGVPLPARASGSRIVVDARIDGRDRPLVLDSGAETIVLFDTPGDAGWPASFGAAGARGEGRMTAAEVALGAVTLGSLPVLRVAKQQPRFGSDGVLPVTAFARLHIDRVAGVVHVVPRR